MTATATVTIPYSEFEAVQTARKEAETEVARLREQIRQTKVEASDPALLKLAHSAIEVVRYAVGSLAPESNRGWPFEALRSIATLLPLMPDAGVDHDELAQTLVIFAKECERHELRRAATPR